MRAIVFRLVVAMVAVLTVSGSRAAAQGRAADSTGPLPLASRGVTSAAMPPKHSETVCDMHARTPPSYVDCGLWFDHGRLRRGAKGDVVGREGFAPIPLQDVVIGDSAQAYAFRYEQDRWIALPFKGLGFVALLTSLPLERHRCKPVGCSNAASYRAAKIWFITGASLSLISVPFTSESNRAGNRATWWHNALLSTIGR